MNNNVWEAFDFIRVVTHKNDDDNLPNVRNNLYFEINNNETNNEVNNQNNNNIFDFDFGNSNMNQPQGKT